MAVKQQAAATVAQQRESPPAPKHNEEQEQEGQESPTGETELNLVDQYAQSESPVRRDLVVAASNGNDQQRTLSRAPHKGPDW